MKFNKIINIEWYWSGRKEAALKRKLQKQVDAAPLFADEIRAEQPTIEEVRDQRELQWNAKYLQERLDRAKAWRSARAKLFALPKAHRKVIRNMWNLHHWRTYEPHYLADLIYGYVVRGKRPCKFQIQKYGDAFQPVDYCEVNFAPVHVPPSKSKASVGRLAAANEVKHEENLNLF